MASGAVHNRHVVTARTRVRARPDKQRVTTRTARLAGLAGFVAALALPIGLWHAEMAAVGEDFRLDATYLVTGWTGYGLIALGLLFLVPVLISIGRHPEDRLYPRSRNAYAAYGICLYLLGMALASQVAQILSVHG